VFTNNLDRIFGYLTGQSEAAGTIGEAAQIRDPVSTLFNWFGLAVYLAGFGLLVILGKVFGGRSYRSELLLIALWSLFMLSMSFTQSRFAYYLAVPVSVLTMFSSRPPTRPHHT
jgi:dolichyl-diphosphooligosaccharide--protein glycosyltransferase